MLLAPLFDSAHKVCPFCGEGKCDPSILPCRSKTHTRVPDRVPWPTLTRVHVKEVAALLYADQAPRLPSWRDRRAGVEPAGQARSPAHALHRALVRAGATWVTQPEVRTLMASLAGTKLDSDEVNGVDAWADPCDAPKALAALWDARFYAEPDIQVMLKFGVCPVTGCLGKIENGFCPYGHNAADAECDDIGDIDAILGAIFV